MQTRTSILYFQEENKSILITRSRDTVKTENFRRETDGSFEIKTVSDI